MISSKVSAQPFYEEITGTAGPAPGMQALWSRHFTNNRVVSVNANPPTIGTGDNTTSGLTFNG